MAGQFVKTDLDGFGDGDNNGLLWERDPAKHREVSKKLSPAFKSKSIKEREPTMQGHIDGFVNRMKECGDTGRGVELRLVCTPKYRIRHRGNLNLTNESK